MRIAAVVRRVAAVVVLSASPVTAAHAQICTPFTDVLASSSFCGNIQWLFNRAITLGCTASEYCPADFVRRDQMAAFLNRLGNIVYEQGGNAFGATAVLGTTDAHPLDVRVNGSRVMRYEPNAISPNVIGGSPANSVTAGVRGATIGGGGSTPGGNENLVSANFSTVSGGLANNASDDTSTVAGGFRNTASGFASTVGGGEGNIASASNSTAGGGLLNTASGFTSTVGGGNANLASADFSTVSGGLGNDASSEGSTVAGGLNNTASGARSTVGGGSANIASGDFSTVAGGASNLASGQFAWAGGSNARTQSPGTGFVVVHHGVFIWSDSTGLPFHSAASNEFAVRSTGGVRFVTGITAAGVPNAGVTLTAGDSSWNMLSDRAAKANWRAVDGGDVLARLLAMPIGRWNYQAQSAAVEHIGPSAQDFRAAFGLGHDDLRIATVDADGVALAAIQGLNAKLEAKIAELAREIGDLRRAVEVLLARDGARDPRASHP